MSRAAAYSRASLDEADMLARFALALSVSADEIIGLEPPARPNGKPRSLRLQRRLQALERLPKRDQEALLRTIDAFLAKSD